MSKKECFNCIVNASHLHLIATKQVAGYS